MAGKTKIIATIGPSSSNKAVLKKMILAGMDVARLNLSHGSHNDHQRVIEHIRSLSLEMERPIGILLDLQGPKIRTGTLKDQRPVVLRKNSVINITTRDIPDGTADMVSTTYAGLARDVTKGDRILLDDGLIELKALSVTKDTVRCKIVNGGILKEHKGINLPGVKVSAPSLTEKDVTDLEFGIRAGVDYIALSFVRSPDDLIHIKALIKKHRADIPVIAKIEKPEAVQNLDSILDAADGVMVARGDLGVELRPELVPTIQKEIINKAIVMNKPVVTATQMLETMISNPIPTRAEASDVANAIFDGTDAVMLSGETALGRYPVKTVQMMVRIALEAENSPFMNYNLKHRTERNDLVTHAVAHSAVNILHELDAKAIIVFSVSGKTSKLISKMRPAKPVYAFSPSVKVFNRLSLAWGITPLIIPAIADTKSIIEKGERVLEEKKLVRKNDLVIIVTGLALKTGSTNMIKIHRVGQRD
ncbi:Pyruvate kinase 1 [uncultured Desulfobacterium sp.]|uniref:Pyruvate kinase n=1 Tax=uncultured Desulfobacterium sp. TaxID=201089 RepID=A0A445MRW0_9BACT|nr:Pyruvate kinase 1 [uncultured Desulfobacterium sp.]